MNILEEADKLAKEIDNYCQSGMLPPSIILCRAFARRIVEECERIAGKSPSVAAADILALLQPQGSLRNHE